MKICAMIEIETDDPRIVSLHMRDLTATVERATAVRAAFIEQLPDKITRLIALFPMEHARLLMQLHQAVGEDIAEATGIKAPFVMPPAGYEPPSPGEG